MSNHNHDYSYHDAAVVTHGYTDGTAVSACAQHASEVPNFSFRGASYSGVYSGRHLGKCDYCLAEVES